MGRGRSGLVELSLKKPKVTNSKEIMPGWWHKNSRPGKTICAEISEETLNQMKKINQQQLVWLLLPE